ncbi:MAG TPA: cupin domain-containing protein [Bacillota bacterium]|nr:cupin domain-containing protein [Bacillota bacterium]HOH09393.1 cupin domain-containing protein [Bacillota bacterium]HOY88740.1 cupin domain-containing protein [Bacillota bacterium]HPI01026.1 cupin domain-containing protein [Bacillota bacterium]HPM64423.1 cupin domain-containing protein [Bacillota bacterium]
MVRRKNEHKETVLEAPFGGPGKVVFHHFATKEDLCEQGRLYAMGTLKPGCGVGYHTHPSNEFEVYHILDGTGELNDNGEVLQISAGDTAWIKPGQSHSLTNNSSKDLVFLALVLYV